MIYNSRSKTKIRSDDDLEWNLLLLFTLQNVEPLRALCSKQK